jgi:hypothetical protein
MSDAKCSCGQSMFYIGKTDITVCLVCDTVHGGKSGPPNARPENLRRLP